ncbi:hypothetical protein MKEN_00825900 [Mycena kentingensis (nom. inval.)]|nr:hypothetical protein MKEN_00825900 [Mycena kentingensis (nom. inval.)]
MASEDRRPISALQEEISSEPVDSVFTDMSTFSHILHSTNMPSLFDNPDYWFGEQPPDSLLELSIQDPLTFNSLSSDATNEELFAKLDMYLADLESASVSEHNVSSAASPSIVGVFPAQPPPPPITPMSKQPGGKKARGQKTRSTIGGQECVCPLVSFADCAASATTTNTSCLFSTTLHQRKRVYVECLEGYIQELMQHPQLKSSTRQLGTRVNGQRASAVLVRGSVLFAFYNLAYSCFRQLIAEGLKEQVRWLKADIRKEDNKRANCEMSLGARKAAKDGLIEVQDEDEVPLASSSTITSEANEWENLLNLETEPTIAPYTQPDVDVFSFDSTNSAFWL